MSEILMTIPDLNVFMKSEFWQISSEFEVLNLEPMKLRTKFKVSDIHLRPGGTVSGPTMFMVADVSAYLTILSMIGPKALSVTTSCGMDFMRRPKSGADLICETRILKLGRSLAVTDALLYSMGQASPVARANMTYSIPPATAANA